MLFSHSVHGGGVRMSLPVWYHVRPGQFPPRWGLFPGIGDSGLFPGGVGTPVLTSSGSHCSVQYTSYWYAFLFKDFIYFSEKRKKQKCVEQGLTFTMGTYVKITKSR